ncbi:MarR family transcriptional regulator [uncultured Cohaesibacter sp.]|uniref:MarR family winged helix-turn-helix transcriptional regulator n=1 Tax=uncultured Cohaesibacter sp. TaxID=1002546 RepID=UPI0029C60DD6|nr:MarR family transcriptional regulator [uncultured Cohaesibacter sp.]
MKQQQKDRAGAAAAQWRQEKPDWDLLPMELFGRISEASNVIRSRHIEPLFAAFGLQGGEFDVLATLRRSGCNEAGLYALTPSQMYDATMISSGGMTNRLDRLEKAGLVERMANPKDRRGTIVALTDKGLALVEQVTERHLANETRLLSALSQTEQQLLNELMAKLLMGVEQMDGPDV